MTTSAPAPETRLLLSPVDHAFAGPSAYSIDFLFVYEQPLDARRVERALEEILPKFWPLASELVEATDRAGKPAYAFAYRRSGFRFESSDAPAKADLNDPVSLAPLLPGVETLPGGPLSRLKVSRLASGGSALGLSVSHALVDGYSYFLFLSALGRAMRGQEVAAPDHRRELLDPRPGSGGAAAVPADEELTSEAFFRRTGFSLDEKPRDFPPAERMRWDLLRFSKEELSELVREASEGHDLRISINDALTARLWKTYGPRWARSESRPHRVTCALDYRRVHPALSPLYFGNAVRGMTAELSLDELTRAPLARVALAVRDSVRQVTADGVEDSLRCFEQFRHRFGPGVMARMNVADPQNGVLVTNLSRVPLGEMDYGAGAPVAIRTLTRGPRAALVFPSPLGGVEVQVCLP